MKKTTNGNSCLISESRHFPNNKKKLRNQRNGNKRQNNKTATNEKTERKKTTRIYGGFWSSSAVKRAISSYYILLLLILSPVCIRRPRENVSPYRPLATPTSSSPPLFIGRVRNLHTGFQRMYTTTFSYVMIFPHLFIVCLLTKEITINELYTSWTVLQSS